MNPTQQPITAEVADGELNECLKVLGMLTIEQMMQPINRFQIHAGMTDLTFFEQWLERRALEYTRMIARREIGEIDQPDDMYEWVLAHRATFHEALVNFRAAKAQDQSAAEISRLSSQVETLTKERDSAANQRDLMESQISSLDDARMEARTERHKVEAENATLKADVERQTKLADLYKAIWNANPVCWFDQKSAENEMFEALQDVLCSLDAMVEHGIVAEGTFPKLEGVVAKYTAVRNQALDARSALGEQS